MTRDFLQATRDRVVVFDGGMGATLESFDLSLEDDYALPGRAHEVLNLRRPDVIRDVHAAMIAAGAEVLETNTFQASRLKLAEWGLDDHTHEINVAAAHLARDAAGEDRFVAGCMGPTGLLPASDDPTLGAITPAALTDVFAEQSGALLAGGVDLLIIETVQDILEAKAAIFGARRAMAAAGRTVPIQVSVSLLPASGTMLLGTDVDAALTTLEALRVDVIGLNCSTGPGDMRDAIRFLGEHAPMPVHCIPNAGLPIQGPDGETVFPESPAELAETLGEFVERFGVGIVGGCCGTTPEHIAVLAERVAGVVPPARPAPRPARVSGMIAAAALVQDPRPTLVGERVNSQGSRRAKELLLAQDYDALVQVAEDQVEGGAHVLDLCVALVERDDEADAMRETVKRIALTSRAPLQIDSTEPDVIRAALEQNPGRAIVNSVNLEAGPAKLDVVAPLAVEHGAALIALTIDEQGMARTAERKREIAERIAELCEAHGLARELLIFDLLTFTLTTGDAEWRPSAVETIEGIRQVKAALPGCLTSLGVSNVSFGVSPPARAIVNSVFLHHCVEAGLDLAMVNPNHITPYAEIGDRERELADDLVLNRREDALERFIAHVEASGAEEGDTVADPTAGMTPAEALHFHILRRRKEGVEDWIDRGVEELGAVPVLNDVLLPAMKEVGDRFGAGELILPFVLQSAEVMKRAVARLENYLDRLEGHTKGTVVLATVFGDVHDIGKSLVNTILTNNGYSVVDLGKQVPIGTILDAAREHDATAIGLSALLVSTSRQMPLCISELHEQRMDTPVLIGGAAINRDFGLRALYPGGRESEDLYEPGVFYCKDAFDGLHTMDQLVEPDRRDALVARVREAARKLRDRGAGARPRAHGRRQRPQRGADRRADPGAAVVGPARGRRRPRRGVPPSRHPRAVQAALGRQGREGRGLAAAAGGRLPPAPGADVARAGLPAPARRARVLPLLQRGQRDRRPGPRRPRDGARAARVPAPAGARPDLPGGLLPSAILGRARRRRAAGRDRRRPGDRAHGRARARGRVRRAAVHARHRRADGGGHGGVAARRGPRRARHPARPGAALLLGLPRLPGAVRAREGLPAARRARDRAAAERRVRGRAGAVHAGGDRPPSAGRLLRDEVGLPAQGRGRGAGRAHRRHRARPRARRDRGRMTDPGLKRAGAAADQRNRQPLPLPPPTTRKSQASWMHARHPTASRSPQPARTSRPPRWSSRTRCSPSFSAGCTRCA